MCFTSLYKPSGGSTVHFVRVTWLCKPWAGATVRFVHVLRGYVSLGGYHCVFCACFMWLCKPWGGTTVHFVSFLRGYVSWLYKPWGGITLHFVCVLHGYALGGYHCVCENGEAADGNNETSIALVVLSYSL